MGSSDSAKGAYMAGSHYGRIFKVATWGESHGVAVGAVVDGCPAGLNIDEEKIQDWLDRRRPGQGKYSTARNEADKVRILSGVFEGKTEGTPISLLVENSDARHKDYDKIKDIYRPGHADFGFDMKYGFRDYRGGGRSSGRETIGRVAAGAIAGEFLKELGIGIYAFSRAIGPVAIEDGEIDLEEARNNPFRLPNKEKARIASDFADRMIEEGDSIGGIAECRISGMPAGIGEPVFDKLDAMLSAGIMSIGAVKGVEIGEGFNAAALRGSENNDPFRAEGGRIGKGSNHSGGILGGMSDGGEIVIRAAFKPAPSIRKRQKSVMRDGEEVDISIEGRHDPLIVPRALVVVEAMAALTIADFMLINMSARLNRIKDFYREF